MHLIVRAGLQPCSVQVGYDLQDAGRTHQRAQVTSRALRCHQCLHSAGMARPVHEKTLRVSRHDH